MRFVVMACIGASGCTPSVVQSALVENSELTARYTIDRHADGTSHASAAFFWTTTDASLLLDDGDSIAVDGIVMALESDFSEVYGTPVTTRDEHVFTLQRPGMPPIEHRVGGGMPLAVTSGPVEGTYDVEATLTWAPVRPEGLVTIVARGEGGCPVITLAAARSDTGSFAFTGADVRPTAEPPPPCMFTIEITREEYVRDDSSPLHSVSLMSGQVATTAMSLR